MDSKIFCPAPLNNLRIENDSSANVVFKPCCLYQVHQPIPTLEQYLHGSEMQTFRSKMLNNESDTSCFRCTVPESMGLTSIRQSFLNKSLTATQTKITSLEIFFGNTCNLGCAMCSSNFSSFAAEERFQSGIMLKRVPTVDNIQTALDTMEHLPDLKSITFIGGEFFLVKRNIEILDKIIERKVKCVITTNASVLTEPLLQKLQQINDLEIGISVDGTESVYEFMRYPANWATLNTNIDILRTQLSWADYCVRFVAQPLNVQNLHELFDWANKKMIATQHQVLVSPEYLTWKILTSQEKQNIVDLLSTKQSKYKITNKQKIIIDNFINGLQQDLFDQDLRKTGIEYLSKLFAHRKISAEVIRKQFGILVVLADQIIERMNETSNHNHT